MNLVEMNYDLVIKKKKKSKNKTTWDVIGGRQGEDIESKK